MACGVLDQDGQWSAPARKSDFLFPAQAWSRVFRGLFLAALAAARAALQIPPSNRLAAESAHAFMARVAKIDVGLCPCKRVKSTRGPKLHSMNAHQTHGGLHSQ